MDAKHLMMDQGGFRVSYRNHLGGNGVAFLKTSDHNEARNETIRMYGGEIDDSPVRIERISLEGNHTHTWYSENIWDSCLTLRWKEYVPLSAYEKAEAKRYARYSRKAGDRK